MLKIHMDPSRLSTQELENISQALRGPCAECIERNVPEQCCHPQTVREFLHAMADAIDGERLRRPH